MAPSVLLPALLLPALLAGCGTFTPFDAPVSWWHNLEGGPIADQRPPPPGEGDPFPNLGDIPKRPVPTAAATRQNIADALSADRTLAEQDAALAPIVPSAPPSPPTLARPTPVAGASQPGQAAQPGQPAQPDQDSGIMASLDAASAPPPAPARPAAKTPAGAPAPDQAADAGLTPMPPPPVDAPEPGRPPDFAVQPPAAPVLPGFDIPRQPPPARVVMSPAPDALPTPPNGPTVAGVTFAPGSAILPSAALPALTTFARQRGKRTVLITGRGEAVSSNPALQGAALALGLERARAIAVALTASGVAPTTIRLASEAAGRGAYLRLVE